MRFCHHFIDNLITWLSIVVKVLWNPAGKCFLLILYSISRIPCSRSIYWFKSWTNFKINIKSFQWKLTSLSIIRRVLIGFLFILCSFFGSFQMDVLSVCQVVEQSSQLLVDASTSLIKIEVYRNTVDVSNHILLWASNNTMNLSSFCARQLKIQILLSRALLNINGNLDESIKRLLMPFIFHALIHRVNEVEGEICVSEGKDWRLY